MVVVMIPRRVVVHNPKLNSLRSVFEIRQPPAVPPNTPSDLLAPALTKSALGIVLW